MSPSTNHHAAPRAQTNGVLPVTASQTTGSPTKAPMNRASASRSKVVVRRLAPGLTEEEFWKCVGEDWKIGQGKVDWFDYKIGKVAKDASKLSRPSRAYLHMTSDDHLAAFEKLVKQTPFEDAQNTWNDSPALIGPPFVEFAPYGRIPSSRNRVDTRQGTIDQDDEFMDFLESQANPVSTKEDPEDGAVEGATKNGEKVTTTPLVQYLKDKKANKAKEAAALKAAKSASSSSGSKSKDISKDGTPEIIRKSAKDAKKDKLVERAAREAVKILNKEAANKGAAAAGSSAEPSKNPRMAARERGNIAAIARTLQRDLGLSAGSAHRRAKADAENAAKAGSEGSQSQTSAPPTGPKAPVILKGRGARASERDSTTTGSKEQLAQATPLVLLKKPAESAPTETNKPTPSPAPVVVAPKQPASAARKPPPIAVPSAGAKRAFVKHANPSQGVTEALLKEAMEVFGAVSNVEIDKRKGFAYVDFVEPEGLVKAMAANPTKIAQGTVQVLERKDAKPERAPPSGPSNRGIFGGGRGGRGGPRGGGRGGRGSGRGSSDATSNAPPSAPTGPANAK